MPLILVNNSNVDLCGMDQASALQYNLHYNIHYKWYIVSGFTCHLPKAVPLKMTCAVFTVNY